MCRHYKSLMLSKELDNIMKSYTARLQNVIPGGAHTYSRGDDQFPSNAPQILKSGKGAYAYSPEGAAYLDYGMALRAVILGYSHEEVNRRAFQEIELGNNLTRPSLTELEAAELFVDTIESADMVKFTKNGSTAVSAAVKLARAATGRDYVARCLEHPFFSYDDWFIGSTAVVRGIPKDHLKYTQTFQYNNIQSLEHLFEKFPNQISCVVLEASTVSEPAQSKFVAGENFLHDVQRVCKKNGAVFILDEMITGFRWHLNGAQKLYGINPDISTFGKGMANGFSVAALAGKREIMELGGITDPKQERVFLLSTTHGAEMCGLGAFIKTVEILKKENVVDHLWKYGEALISEANNVIKKHNLGDYIKFDGVPCSPYYLICNKNNTVSLPLRTLFQQEMIKQGVLMPWIALSHAHSEKDLQLTTHALDRVMPVLAQAIELGVDKFLVGASIKPVFRQWN